MRAGGLSLKRLDAYIDSLRGPKAQWREFTKTYKAAARGGGTSVAKAS